MERDVHSCNIQTYIRESMFSWNYAIIISLSRIQILFNSAAQL